MKIADTNEKRKIIIGLVCYNAVEMDGWMDVNDKGSEGRPDFAPVYACLRMFFEASAQCFVQ